MAYDAFLLVRSANGPTFVSTTLDAEFKSLSGLPAMEIGSFSLGGANPQFIRIGGNGRFAPLIITKQLDFNSPSFQNVFNKGSHLDRVTLTLRKAGVTPLKNGIFTIYSFGTVSVVSYAHDGNAGDDFPTETLHFNYLQFAENVYNISATGAVSVSVNAWDSSLNNVWAGFSPDGPHP